MTDPKRWNETDDASDDARLLVATLAKAEPTAAMRESVWAKVAATLPTGPGDGGPNDGGNGTSGGATGTGPTGGAALGTGAKLMAAAALTAGALSIWLLTRTNAPPTPTPAPTAASTSVAPPAPTPPTPTPAPTPAPAPTEPPTPTAAPPSPIALTPTAPSLQPRPTPSATPQPAASGTSTAITPTLPADRLREETEGAMRARRLLREKNPAAALTELDRLARLFPNGPLEEEREVLTIEALVGSASSNTAALGRRRAERFLAERPQSVHAARVRELSGH